ncbi:class I SAM-dependent methyltransferase [Ilyomonas limi]|uniref:Class I SAM-dependent methyltransferase n=1 Tax=Ilyomonas limi TaxID=2575867 RepID=A0A4U3KSH1_9BACT|nr:class I SAM-dependent methyltransferase [Ilyomonas limi]TKK65241.1 class I SAM-dependent methyltransferase [Ilyomonas limi]
MADNWIDKWNQRYANNGFAYGEKPNNYLKEQLEKLNVGTILFPAEGEGRNAVFAATLGWTVFAFDISSEGQKKARRLAETNNVTIDYRIGELQTLNYKEEQFDAIALIYAHFPANVKSYLHKTLNNYLRKGGTIILEAFSKSHLNYLAKNEKVGGPKDIGSLFSVDEIETDFDNYDMAELKETVIHLHEGLYHNGQGAVIRFVGRKK